jgi:hypothetical protein
MKTYLKAKKENYGNSNISPSKNIIFKKSSKKNQIPSRYYNSIIINLKFFLNISQNIISKNPHIKIDLLLPRGQNPLKATILYNESKHNILALVSKANKKRWDNMQFLWWGVFFK